MQETCIAATRCSPAELVEQLTTLASGCLHIVETTPDTSLEWFLYVKQGQLVYATNTADPFERIERHLRGMPQMSNLSNGDLRAQVKQMEQETPPDNFTADYQALRWIVEQGHCDAASLSNLASKMSAEVLEGYLLLPAGNYEVHQRSMGELPSICQLELTSLWPQMWARLDQWNAMAPRISSPYQRPYLIGEERARRELSPKMANKLSRLLLGCNFRQLAMLLKQDELAICRRFMPLISEGLIILREPLSPYEQLPQLNQAHIKSPRSSKPFTAGATQSGISRPGDSSDSVFIHGDSHSTEQRTWKIVCIDDSPTILREVKRFLQQDIFEITMIDDSQKALMKIISIKPDLILLDANMPGLDGYQVCTMIRKSSLLKHIPVVMVTGNKSLLDRARAKMAGTTDYLTKPFTQKDLLQIVLRYLSD